MVFNVLPYAGLM